ncbi:MAG: class I SAM-dependent methyltransferase [Bacteriovoracia bacterium]
MRTVIFLALTAIWGCSSERRATEPLTPGKSNYQQVTGDDSSETRSRWDALFSTHQYVFGKDPAKFLQVHVGKLPIGRALDIAMGEGRNAVFLAKKGFSVDGVDISEVALRKARRLAKENQVSINTIYADLATYAIKPGHYDVIVNIDYLQRSLVPHIKRGLRKGGVVVFENNTVEQLNNPSGKSMNRDFLLETGELKKLFSDFEILVYLETNDGAEAKASLVARKRD